ncbi:MAG: conjugal transfer protein TraD [Alphaproteobacteria bacterium]|nr:conjugal transfer protein TraD [Alphaproteobacteria bacterium]
MDSLSLENRRTRTRFLIQLGGLVEKSGLLETFGITLGENLQKSPDMKEPVAALFKGFLVLNEMANSEDVNLQIWASQGLDNFKKIKFYLSNA